MVAKVLQMRPLDRVPYQSIKELAIEVPLEQRVDGPQDQRESVGGYGAL